MKALPLLFLLSLFPAPAQDLYLLPERFVLTPGAAGEVALHNGDFFPGSEFALAPERYLRARLSSGAALRVWEERGDSTVVAFKAPAVPGSFYALLETVAMPRELEADDFEAYLADEGATEINVWRSRQGEARRPGRELIRRSAKALLTAGAPGAGFDRPAGHPLEIIPLRNPATLKPGEELPVRILFRGAPLKGAQVNVRWVDAAGRMGSTAAGPTDARGQAVVRVEAAGRWKLHTLRLVRRLNRGEADWDTYSASLTFANGDF